MCSLYMNVHFYYFSNTLTRFFCGRRHYGCFGLCCDPYGLDWVCYGIGWFDPVFVVIVFDIYPARHMFGIPHYDYKQHKSFTRLSHNCETHFLRLVHVHLRWVRFVLIWRHISGRSHSRHSFLPYLYSWVAPDLFSWSRTMALIIPMVCASRMRFLKQIRRYRNTTD